MATQPATSTRTTIQRLWTQEEYWRLPEGPPDLVVEVLSPSTASRDKTQKLRAYLRAGVPWYWLVETESLLITEYRYTPDGYLVSQTIRPLEPFAPGLFPGLSFRMADLIGASNLEEESHE